MIMADTNNSVRPRNFVWMLGSGRTGSRWLAQIIRELGGWTLWGEPLVGKLFGDFYYSPIAKRRADHEHFILPPNRENVWVPALRAFVLESVNARFPDAERVLVKEPEGSHGAIPLLKACRRAA